LNGPHQLLACADGGNLMGEKHKHDEGKRRGCLSVAGKEVRVNVDTDGAV
jgi:hypothetical protein